MGCSLIQRCNHWNHICVCGEHACNLLYDIIRTLDIGRIRMPMREAHPLTRVVKPFFKSMSQIITAKKGIHLPILASRSPVKIDNEFQTMVSSPGNGFLQVRYLTLNKRLSGPNLECPITNWQPDMIQPLKLNRVNIGKQI